MSEADWRSSRTIQWLQSPASGPISATGQLWKLGQAIQSLDLGKVGKLNNFQSPRYMVNFTIV